MSILYGAAATLDLRPSDEHLRGAVISTTCAPARFTVRAMQRQCSRSGCAEPACTTLTYQYGRAQVWLDDLSAERDPHGYDLCARHTTRLSVPNGWRLEDRRSAKVLAFSGVTRLAG